MDFLEEMIERRDRIKPGFREYVNQLCKEKGLQWFEETEKLEQSLEESIKEKQ